MLYSYFVGNNHNAEICFAGNRPILSGWVCESRIGKGLIRKICLSAVLSLLAGVAYSGVFDSATFVLDVRGDLDGDQSLGAEEIGNALTYRENSSSVSGFTSVFSPGAKELPSIKQTIEGEVSNPYWGDATTCNYLYLPQTCWNEDGGTKKCDSAMLKFPASASLSDTVTIYSRFRWDGPITAFTDGPSYQILARNAYVWESSSSIYGWMIGVKSPKSSDGLPATTGWLVATVGGSESGTSSLEIESGKWYDAFWTIKKIDESSTKVVVTIVPSGRKLPQIWSISSTVQKPLVFDSSKSDMYIGSYSASSKGPSNVSRNGETSGRLFRGGIARFIMWERELTQTEMREVSGGFQGAMWTIGMANGSADEFGADDYSLIASRKAESVKDVFRPELDPVRLMRGKLTESYPVLTLKGSMAASEEGLAKMISIKPLFAEAGEKFPVKITVNGNEVGNLDLRRDTALFIKKRFWTRDENGDVELRIERTSSAEGSVEIDSIMLGGSFQIGTANGATSDMGDESTAPEEFFAGDSNVEHIRRALMGYQDKSGKYNSDTNLYIYVDIPARMGEWCDFAYTTSLLIDKNHPEWGNRDFSLQLNGQTIWQNTGVANKDLVTVSIPHGTFRDGLNELRWVLQTQEASSWWINCDFHRLELLKDHKTVKGLQVKFR